MSRYTCLGSFVVVFLAVLLVSSCGKDNPVKIEESRCTATLLRLDPVPSEANPWTVGERVDILWAVDSSSNCADYGIMIQLYQIAPESQEEAEADTITITEVVPRTPAPTHGL